MSDSVSERRLSFAKFLADMSPEETARINGLNRREALEEHARFTQAFKAGQCSFCGGALTSFDAAQPCRHWLLKPDGFGKEHFEQLAEKYSLSVLENYLRWVANEEALAKNINDLADEGTGKLVELTIKYKNLQWSFSCAASDLDGHEGGGEHSKRPHYHFQMYVDGKPFIRYNDFHLALSDVDAGFLEFKRANPGKVKTRVAGGAGMDELLDVVHRRLAGSAIGCGAVAPQRHHDGTDGQRGVLRFCHDYLVASRARSVGIFHLGSALTGTWPASIASRILDFRRLPGSSSSPNSCRFKERRNDQPAPCCRNSSMNLWCARSASPSAVITNRWRPLGPPNKRATALQNGWENSLTCWRGQLD